MHRLASVVAGASFFFIATFLPPPALAAPCESLIDLSLPDATIIVATSVAAGSFTPPALELNAQSEPLNVPAFCRIVGRVKPAINFEVWMPAAGWNGKFQGVGNGGFAGSIRYRNMAAALNRGYATASTDTGHVASSNQSWALGHPELVVDYGYRAIHETAVKAKVIVQAFYDRSAQLSYFVGCSNGGRQGLMEAQRYPADYDGIVVGAPTNFMAHQLAGTLWFAASQNPAGFISPSKYQLIHKAVLATCDARDGVSDGLADPARCAFDPKTLLCEGTDGETCLTAAQVETVEKVYSGARNPRTGQEIYPGRASYGHESEGGGMPTPDELTTEFFKYFVFEDPDWDWRTFDFDADVARADAKLASVLHAVDPNLTAFQRRGGKIIMYGGWNDNLATNSINYYNSVSRLFGATQTDTFLRHFMAPGMEHCIGSGPGPNTFDPLAALEQWIEHGQAPDQIIASHSTNGVVDRTRPLCPYPQVAEYKGAGSTDDAENFECRMPPQPLR